MPVLRASRHTTKKFVPSCTIAGLPCRAPGYGVIRIRAPTAVCAAADPAIRDQVDLLGSFGGYWHLADVGRYEVRFARDDGTGGRFGAAFTNDAGTQDFKVGVCMFDDLHLDCSSANTADRNMWSCEIGPQGQTGRNDPDVPGEDHTGWVDQYHQSLDGQDLDITGAPVGVYYLVGAFVVGITAQRFRERLPAIASDQMLHAVEVFASFFVPFYFFSAGLHVRHEDFAGEALRRQAGRGEERAAHHLAGEDQAQDRALFGRLHHVHDERHLRQVGMLLERKLHQQLDGAIVDPGGVIGLDARPGPAAAGLHLAALHGKRNVVPAGITGDDAHPGAENVVDRLREKVGVGRGAGPAHEHLARVELLEAVDAVAHRRFHLALCLHGYQT